MINEFYILGDKSAGTCSVGVSVCSGHKVEAADLTVLQNENPKVWTLISAQETEQRPWQRQTGSSRVPPAGLSQLFGRR